MGLSPVAANDPMGSDVAGKKNPIAQAEVAPRISHSAPELLLDLTTRELLDRFGAGKHKPGSGSAAALAGVISCKLLHTVISLCRARAPKIDKIRASLAGLNKFDAMIVSKIEPYLMSAVQTDADQFHHVIAARNKRDAEADAEKRLAYEDEALLQLVVATEIPLEIAQHCLELAERGLEVFDRGFDSARGDTGVAVATALSTALGALSVVFLNLKSFRTPEWMGRVQSLRDTADQLFERAGGIQTAIYGRVQRLQRESSEGLTSPQMPLI